MIKFIASDIDGTLLKGEQRELDPELFDLIRKLKAHGIRFAAATGRQYYGLRQLFEPVKDQISYVTENGSLCIHDNQILSSGIIERPLALRIFDAIHQYKKCYALISCQSTMYTETNDPAFLRLVREHLRYKVEVVPNLKDVQDDFLKIAIYQTSGTKEMDSYFSPLFQKEIKLVSSADNWLDFIAPNANKATGIAALLKHFDIDPKDCVAFGDQYNDVEMLQYAGTSYAMSNAAPGMSYYSTYVTDSVIEVLRDILADVETSF
jgi:HAD-superfamily hydrolase, subfamily IIB